jgi:sigma-54-specific transcriptional regulator
MSEGTQLEAVRQDVGQTDRLAPCLPDADKVFEDAVTLLLSAPVDRVFRYAESRLVRIAFDRNGLNQVRTARALGISRNVLRTLLKRHGVIN